jgi:hypothetical protein
MKTLYTYHHDWGPFHQSGSGPDWIYLIIIGLAALYILYLIWVVYGTRR